MAFKMIFAQQAIADALAIDYMQKGEAMKKPIFKETKSRKTGANLRNARPSANNNGAIMDRVYAGKILAAIPSNRNAQKLAWFVYGPVVFVAELEHCAQWLYSKFYAADTNKRFLKSLKQSRRVQELIVYALMNYRNSRLSGRAQYSIVDICHGLKISPGNWARDWSPVYDSMTDIIDRLDHSILKPVRAVIDIERGFNAVSTRPENPI